MQSWEGELSLADTARVCCVGLDCFYWSAGGNESAFLQWVRFRMVAVEDLSDGLESSMRGHGGGAQGFLQHPKFGMICYNTHNK